MAEGKTNMFGKTYNTIGSTDSNFIIKTKGDLKVLWGNKFIDVIKNGKIASKDSNLLKQVVSKDDIKGDGIYILKDSTVCISIGDTIIDLLGDLGTTYVSFLEEQKTTAEQKYQALLNIGFIYNTLKEVEEASLQSGIIYIAEKNKLYTVVNGKIQEYLLSLEPEELEKEEVLEKPLTELIIGDLKIYNDVGYSKFNSSTRIQLLINNNPYISLDLNLIKVHKSLVMDDDFCIQSSDASSEKGFRLYNNNDKSTLEVDNIIWRNIDNQLPSNKLTEGIIYSKYDNIITEVVLETLIEYPENFIPLYAYLKYKNFYKPGQFVYFYPNTYLIVGLEQIADRITVFLENSRTCDEDITISITYNDTETLLLTIPSGSNSIETSLVYTIINEIKIINAPEEVVTKNNLKNTKYEFEIIDSQDDHIVILVPIELQDTILTTSFDSLIHLSRDPYIEIIGNNILVLDRSKTVTIGGETLPDESVHTKIGVIKETEIKNLIECPTEEADKKALEEYESSIQVGIYSDNFIGLNSKLYNPIFKKRCEDLYPKYDEALTIPEDRFNEKYDQVVPNIGWIKQLLEMAIPTGTIVMWHGSEIPDGWAICDGNNGTPNLIGKFIKASDKGGETGGGGNYTIGGNSNYVKLKEKHLPDHTHGIAELTTSENGSHTHSYSDEYTDWKTSGTGHYDTTNITTTGDTTFESLGLSSTSYKVSEGDYDRTSGSNGAHTHTIPATNTSGVNNVTNNAFSIEPSYFSLIFIMKLPTNILQN